MYHSVMAVIAAVDLWTGALMLNIQQSDDKAIFKFLEMINFLQRKRTDMRAHDGQRVDTHTHTHIHLHAHLDSQEV